MLRLKTNLVISITLLASFLVILLLNNSKAIISSAEVELPGGAKKNIELPYSSQVEGQLGEYTYSFTITNTIFFSGKLQIIPDDCITEVMVNGENLKINSIDNGYCDTRNGFYLDISSKLRKDKNLVKVKVINTQVFYGLDIIDITFYEKYLLLILLVISLLVVNFKKVFLVGLDMMKRYLRKNSTFVWILICLLCTLVTILVEHVFTIPPNSRIWIVIGLSFTIVGTYLFYSIYKECLFPISTILLFVLALSIWILFLIYLPYNVFAYDIEGHVEYIRYLDDKEHIPVASGGWSFYHPSFYYISSTIFWKILNVNLQLNDHVFKKILQAFSLHLFLFYIYFSIKTFDLYFKHLRETLTEIPKMLISLIYFLTVALLFFWPANSITGVRIGNDIMFNLLFTISFYFIANWWFSFKTNYFLLSLLFFSLTVWTKTNAFILVGIISVLLCLKFLTTEGKSEKNKLKTCFLLLVTFTSFSFYFSFHQKLEYLQKHPEARLIVGNANELGSQLVVESKLSNFLSFNPEKFVKTPFTSSTDDSKGRDSFLFFLFKSSMFGEFSMNNPYLIFLAKILSFFFLLVFMIFLYGFALVIRRSFYFLPLGISICALISSMVLFRIYYPYSCANDFRYIYPALTPFILFTGYGCLKASKNKILFYLMLTSLSGFVISSVLFQLINIVIIYGTT